MIYNCVCILSFVTICLQTIYFVGSMCATSIVLWMSGGQLSICSYRKLPSFVDEEGRMKWTCTGV